MSLIRFHPWSIADVMQRDLDRLAGHRVGIAGDVDGIERYERVTGRFLRRVALPETVDAEAITAKSNNGLLEIAIPKLPEMQPRRITVDAA